MSLMSTNKFLVASNVKYMAMGGVLFLIAVVLVDYASMKANFPAGTEESGSIHRNTPWKALRKVRRSDDKRNSTNKSTAPILCWVLTRPKNHRSKAIHVKRTWGTRCDKLIFISTKTDLELGAISIPGVLEGRDWLWAKTKGALQYIWEEHQNDYDWFLKADDDTYVVMENLRYFLKDYNSSKPYYFGCRVKYPRVNASVNFGGAGYVLSKDALRIFVEEALPDAEKCKQDHYGTEDTELGKCLYNVGVTPADTRDENGKHRFLHSYPKYHFGLAKQKWGAVRDHEAPGLKCCSPGLISFHRVNPDTLYSLEFLIYHFHLYGIGESSLPLGE